MELSEPLMFPLNLTTFVLESDEFEGTHRDAHNLLYAVKKYNIMNYIVLIPLPLITKLEWY